MISEWRAIAANIGDLKEREREEAASSFIAVQRGSDGALVGPGRLYLASL